MASILPPFPIQNNTMYAKFWFADQVAPALKYCTFENIYKVIFYIQKVHHLIAFITTTLFFNAYVTAALSIQLDHCKGVFSKHHSFKRPNFQGKQNSEHHVFRIRRIAREKRKTHITTNPYDAISFTNSMEDQLFAHRNRKFYSRTWSYMNPTNNIVMEENKLSFSITHIKLQNPKHGFKCLMQIFADLKSLQHQLLRILKRP